MKRVGIDIGGTGIQIGLVDENLKIISEGSVRTHTSLPFEEQIREIASCIASVLESAGTAPEEVASIGVGIPGIANDRGEVIKCTNMGWEHVPFREELQKYYDKPVLIDNDANVAALAESLSGVSAGTSSSVFITIGTGIGSGIIINGKIWKGAHGIGGELGHVIMDLDGVPCTCGNHGCLERYCSATAIIRMGIEAAAADPHSLMNRLTEGDPRKFNARTVFDAAKMEDPSALIVFHRFIDYLAQAIASVINLLDPEVIVLGGGVSKAGSFLLDPLIKNYRKYVIFHELPAAEIKIATLGAEAGIIGASMLS